MDIAVIHYHLNPGGVTQVMRNHLQAITAAGGWPGRIAILYGGRQEGWSTDITSLHAIHAIAGLEYDQVNVSPVNGVLLAEQIQERLHDEGFQPESTLIHAHNHALGKNAALPGALRQLAQRGYRLLLQIHDFAEDFRPQNYRHLADRPTDGTTFPSDVYPQGPQVHYAALNSRDLGTLSRAGVAAQQLHYLPNPVVALDPTSSVGENRASTLRRLGLPAESRLLLYPVRGIRRKNVGEMLLYAALSPRDTHFAITLAPKNPNEAQSFVKWTDFASQVGLRCLFDTGGHYGIAYGDGVNACDALLTTSVAEGFGMGFLEAWLAGRPLVGRNLPDITDDFVAAGVEFPHLHDSLWVPLNWIDRRAFIDDLSQTFQRAARSFDRPADNAAVLTERIESLVCDNNIDFAHLSSPLQSQVIRRAATDDDARDTLFALNPKLNEALRADASDCRATITSNAEVVRSAYGAAALGKRLIQVYETAQNSPLGDVSGLNGAAHILDDFLDIRRMHPVRLEP